MIQVLHFFIELAAAEAETVHGQLATFVPLADPFRRKQAAVWGGWSPTGDLMVQRCSSRTGDEDHPRANSGYRGLSLRAQGKWAPLVSGAPQW